MLKKCRTTLSSTNAPNTHSSNLLLMSTYETSSCDAANTISRYFTPNKQLEALGIEWCPTIEYQLFAKIPGEAVPLYGKQLPVNAGSSVWI